MVAEQSMADDPPIDYEFCMEERMRKAPSDMPTISQMANIQDATRLSLATPITQSDTSRYT